MENWLIALTILSAAFCVCFISTCWLLTKMSDRVQKKDQP